MTTRCGALIGDVEFPSQTFGVSVSDFNPSTKASSRSGSNAVPCKNAIQGMPWYVAAACWAEAGDDATSPIAADALMKSLRLRFTADILPTGWWARDRSEKGRPLLRKTVFAPLLASHTGKIARHNPGSNGRVAAPACQQA